MTPESRKLWRTILISSFAVLVVLAIVAYPAFTSLKKWRAHSLIEESKEKQKLSDLIGAVEAAQAAYQLEPDDVETVRNIAELYAQLDPVRALVFWEKLVELSASPDDRIRLVQVALQDGDLNVAAAQIAALKKIRPNDPKVIEIEVTFYALNNDLPNALKSARRAVYIDNPPADLAMFYVQLTQVSPQIGDRIEGIEYLKTLSKRQDELGLKALRNLAHYPANSRADLAIIAQELQDHPMSGRTDKLLSLAIQQELGQVDSHALFVESQKLFDTQNSENLLELARWLNQQGLSNYTVELISQKQAMQRRDVFLVWVDALALNHQWERLRTIMNTPHVPIEDFVRKLFLARIDLELGDPQRAQNDWNAAIISADRDAEKLWFLANYAQDLGLNDWQRDVLVRLIKIPQAVRPAYEALIHLDQREGNLYALHTDLTQMHALFDDDAPVANDWAYTGLLLNANVAEASEVAQQNYKKAPEFLAFRITLALSYLRTHEPEKALKLFDGVNVTWSQVRPSWQAVYASVLKANGGTLGAEAIYDRIPKDQLFDAEKALYQNPLKTNPAGSAPAGPDEPSDRVSVPIS